MDEKRTTINITAGTIVKAALIVGLIYALFYLRDIVLILLTSVVFASAIEPVTQWFIRRKIPRVLSVIIIYALVIIAIIAVFYFILPPFLNDLSGFLNALPQYIQTLNVKVHNLGSGFFSWQSAVQGFSNSESFSQTIQNFVSSLSIASGGILSTLSAIFGGFVSFLLILVITFYLAVQERGVEEFLKLVIPIRREQYIISLWHRTQNKIGKWLQGQIILSLIVGVLVFIGLTILGVPNPFFLALISTIFEIIPVFGPFIGAVPGVAIGFLHGGLTLGIIVIVMYVIVQQIEGNVIYPLVVQRVLNVHPLVVIVALIVGYKLGGILGIILSVPIAAALTEFMNDVGKKRSVARENFNREAV